jgi:hypothetical protein
MNKIKKSNIFFELKKYPFSQKIASRPGITNKK